ncbi:hypothetical protein [Rhodococcus koreensis]
MLLRALALPGPAGIAHVNDFNVGVADLADYNITGQNGGGNALAVTVASGVAIQNETSAVKDANLFLTTQMLTDDIILRFKVGKATSATSTWWSNNMIRSNSTMSEYVSSNFAINALYLERWLNGSPANTYKSLATSAANLALGSVLELSAIGNKYAVVYETSAGVRSEPVTPYTDSPVTRATGPGNRWVGFRISQNGSTTTRSASNDRWEAYDLAIWPVHSGLTKSGTLTYGTANAWQPVTGWTVRAGYPHTTLTSNACVMRGDGTIQVTVNRAWSATGTSDCRVLKNGVVQWTSTSASGSAVAATSTDIDVVAGDAISVEFRRTSTGTIATGSYIQCTPVAYAPSATVV